MARKKGSRVSYCLRHQERPTETRCSACLKPICQECTLATELGNFCGSECYEKRVASNERVDVLRKEDEANAGLRLLRTLLSWLWPLLILCLLFWFWPKLPADWRAPFESVFKHKR